MKSFLVIVLTVLFVSANAEVTLNPNLYPQIGDERCDPEWNIDNGKSGYDWTSEFQMLDQQNNKPYVGSASWYYDPNTPGIGLSMTLQQSEHSSTGYFGFGVFYTYNEDGSQAWYPVDGFYQPTYKDESAYWQYDTEFFGTHVIKGSTLFWAEDKPGVFVKARCWWGHDNTYLGELSSVLIKTADGAVVDGAYSPHQVELVGDVRIRWVSPDEVEIYLNGATTPQHTFIRHKFNSGAPERNADFLLENTYYLNMSFWGGIWKKFLPCWDDENEQPNDPELGCQNALVMNMYKGVVEFERFDHSTDMPNNNTPSIGDDLNSTGDLDSITAYYPNNYAAEDFHRRSAWVPRHVNYISKECIPGRVDFNPHYPMSTPYYDSLGQYGVYAPFTDASDWCTYIVMTYDPLYDDLSAYIGYAWYDDNDVSRGMQLNGSGYKFKAPLPQSDSALVNLFPATGWSSNNSLDSRDFFMNRSHFTLHRLPKLGGLFKELPNIYTDGWNLDVDRGE